MDMISKTINTAATSVTGGIGSFFTGIANMPHINTGLTALSAKTNAIISNHAFLQTITTNISSACSASWKFAPLGLPILQIIVSVVALAAIKNLATFAWNKVPTSFTEPVEKGCDHVATFLGNRAVQVISIGFCAVMA